MSEDSDRHEKNEDLEALLRQLVPAPLHVDLLEELNRDRELLVMTREKRPTGIRWRRVIPLTLVGSLTMIGFGVFRFGDRLPQTGEPAEAVARTATPATGMQEERFLPVSAHGYLLNTSSGGVVQTEDGPRERLNLEYQDAYHWHDPESGTNIRLFQPRSEEVIIPLQTD